MTLGIRLAGEMLARLRWGGGQERELRGEGLVRAPAQTYGYFEALVWMCLTDLLRARDGLFVAAGQRNTILLGHDRPSLCCF
jgi:hypothetical protein